jgi:VWFA-related protein
VKRLLTICAALVWQTVAGQDTTIRTTVPLVVLPTSVTDKHGAVLSGLTASDFIVLDEGKPKSVNIDVVDSGLAPIALVVLIQTSETSSSALAKIRKMGALLSQSVLGENGELAVVTFSDRVDIVQDFTRDADQISTAFTGLKTGTGMEGRMLDAVSQSLRMLSDRPGSRRSNVLVIGESKDRGSDAKMDALAQTIQSTAVTIYGLKYSAYWTAFTTKPEDYAPSGGDLLTGIGEVARLGKQNTMEALTGLTGGVAAGFETKSKLEKDLMQLSRDIHSRYLVSFVPDKPEARMFHRVSIRIRNHPDAVVRTRPGYWAAL